MLFFALGNASTYAADVDCNTHNPEIKPAGGDGSVILLSWCRVASITGYPNPNAYPGLFYNAGAAPKKMMRGIAITSPTTTNSLRTFNGIAMPTVANHGTTVPTVSSCAALTYVTEEPIVTGDHYCVKFTDGTDTGYIYAYWNGTTLSIPTPPAATSASAAPATIFNWGLLIISFLFVGIWGYRQYNTRL